ncbi:hypothetical protein AGR3A_Lc130260 [Agrobacterium tomkonis CFBP 6623]|uniref:Uncharacterized protein n=1 Tax=Agrobacterium tomkonis CFBP 6623 TaxID=1183432 RepID=A0A1S7RC34_9HYPH|nr:hypothetical protein AGR3A_Lc130260 [Agrobacterium tomkonis CFBP 6623]
MDDHVVRVNAMPRAVFNATGV